MAKYIKLPDNSLFPVAEGEDYTAAMRAAYAKYPEAFGAPAAPVAAPKEGLMADVMGAGANLMNLGRTGIAALTGDTTQAAQAGVTRQEELQKQFKSGFDPEKITAPFEQGQYGTAAGEALKQVPSAVATVAPSVLQTAGLAAAGRLGGGALGSVFGPVGAVAGAQVGQYALPAVVGFIQALGGQAQEKVQTQKEAGEKPDVNALELAPYAAGSAALDLIGAKVSMPSFFKKMGGQKVAEETADAAAATARKELIADARKVAGRGTFDTILRGTGGFAVGELPTEVLQEVIDRAAVGKSLTDDEAMKSYRSTALMTVLAAPIGAGVGISGRAGARTTVEQEDKQLAAKAAAEAEAAKNSPEALAQLDTQYQDATRQMAALQKIIDVKPTKASTPEEKQAHAQAKQEMAKLRTENAPVLAEYAKRKEAIGTMQDAQLADIEQKAAEGQPTAAAPTPSGVSPVPMPKLMERYDQLRTELDTVETQLAAGPSLEEQTALSQQRQALKQQTDAYGQLLQERGGVAMTAAEHTQAVKEADAALAREDAARKKLLTEGAFDEADKQAAKIAELMQQRQELVGKRELFQETAAYTESAPGETQKLFAEEEMPAPVEQKPLTYVSEEGKAITPPAPESAAPVSTEVVTAGVEQKLQKANEELATAVESKNEAATTEALKKINEAEAERSRALAPKAETLKGKLDTSIWDIFSPHNVIATAVGNNDKRTLAILARVEDRRKLDALESRSQEEARIQRLLDERLGLGGTQKAETEKGKGTGQPLRSVKRERADLFNELYDLTAQSKFKNGTSQEFVLQPKEKVTRKPRISKAGEPVLDRNGKPVVDDIMVPVLDAKGLPEYEKVSLQDIYDKQGVGAVEMAVVMDQIRELRKKVETPQGNAKTSLYQKLVDLSAQHEALLEQKEAGLASPTMGEKVAGVQAKLGKGAAPAAREMDAAEKYNLERKLTAIENEYNAVLGKVAPIRQKIDEVYSSLYKEAPLETVEAEREAKKALLLPETGARSMSRTARTQARIASGDVRKEAETSQKMRDLARDLGTEEADYKKFEKAQLDRYTKLKAKYGQYDPAVATFQRNMAEELNTKAMELGKATPEYKATLKEQIEVTKEALAGSKQTLKSKRGTQTTRKVSLAKKEEATGSPESRAVGAKRHMGKALSTKEQERLTREINESDAAGREEERFARGVEVESPDLSPTQVALLQDNDIEAALQDIASDKGTSALNRAVAQRLSLLLDITDVEIVPGLKDKDGKEVLGMATSRMVSLNADGGVSQEVLLHEGVHAGTERVIQMYEKDPSQLTEIQRVAVRELKALHAAAKADPRVTSANAKSSLSEFVAEVMSNKNLQEQLRKKAWKLSDAWAGFKSAIMRLLGVTESTGTMLGAAITAVDALFIPPTQRFGKTEAAETPVAHVLAQKDIAALDSGSNSMREFAAQFGLEIKQKDRTPEDADRIGEARLRDMRANPEDYVSPAEPDKLDYRVTMSDGKPFDADNLQHYVEADGIAFAKLKAQENPFLREQEAEEISRERQKDLKALIKDLLAHPEYTYVEQALVAKAAAKYSVAADKNGRLKLVTIDTNNRHPVAVVGVKGAAAIIEELRTGKTLKDAFLIGLQRNADMYAKDNERKQGWQKFDQSSKEEDVVALNAGAAGTAWCTGNSALNYARGQLEGGDFYIHYTNGKPDVAVRMYGADRIGEIRGNTPNQSLTQEQQQLAKDFLQNNNFKEADGYIKQLADKQLLSRLLAGQVSSSEIMSLGRVIASGYGAADEGSIDSYHLQKLFNQDLLDGYGGRPRLSDTALAEAKRVITQAVTKAYEEQFFVGASVGLTGNEKDNVVKFNGKTYAVDPATVRGVRSLDIFSTERDALPQIYPALEKAETVSLVSRGVNVLLPKIKHLASVTMHPSADGLPATLGVSPTAVIESVRFTDSSNDATLVITGAMDVRDVITVGVGGHTVVLPDALYVSKGELAYYGYEPKWAVKGALEKRLSEAKKDVYENVDSSNPSPGAAKIIDPFIKQLEALVTSSEERKALAAERDSIADRQGRGKALSANQEIVAIVGALYDDVDKTALILALNKRLNDSGILGKKLLPTKEGVISAPKKIAGNAPVQELVEAPEVPVYAPKAYGVKDEGKGVFSFTSRRTPGEFDATPEPSAMDKVLGNIMGLAGRMQLVDKFAAVSEAFKVGMNKGVLTDVEAGNAEFLMRFGEHRSQLAGQVLTNGPLSLVTTKTDKGISHTYKSTKGANALQMAEALNKGGFTNDSEAEGMLTLYVAGARAKQVGWEKLNYSSPDAEKAKYQRMMDILNSDKPKKDAIEAAAKIYQQFNNGQMDFLVQTGELTAAKAAELKAITYIPFYRVNANGEVQLMIDKEHPVRIGNIKDEPQLQQLVGDNKQIMPIFTSMVQNTFMLTNLGLRNQSVKETAFMLRKVGIASRIASGPGPAGPSTVRFKKNGVDMHVAIDTDMYGIPAKYIVEGMEGIKTTIPAVVKLLGMPADVLRQFVTRAPTYAIRQMIRDPLNAWLTTGTDAVPVLSSFKELASMVAGRSETERTLMEAGAVSSNVFTGDERDMGKVLREITSGKAGWTKLMAKADAFALQGDTATRAVIYKDSIAKGMSHQQALLRSVESMNFSRRGLSPSIQMLSTMIPFFNAQIQGLDVLYRAFKGDMPYNEQLKVREKLFRRGLMLAVGTMAYAAAMQDDEAYKRAKPEERYGNWFLYVPGFDEPVRVPIPFELGYLFKALPEAVFNVAFGDEKASTAAKGIGTLLAQSNPFALPQAIKPLTEVVLGKSFFSGDIESEREKGVMATERYRDSSTEVAKLIGSVTGEAGLSPIKIDYLIRGYTGGLGIALVQLANPLLNTETSDVAKPSVKPSKMPFIGGLFQPVEGRGTLDAAYDKMVELQQIKGTYNDLLEKGKRAEAQAFVQQYANQLALVSTSGSVQKALGEMAKQERAVKASKTLTTEQKDVALERLDKMKVAYARQFLTLADRTTPR